MWLKESKQIQPTDIKATPIASSGGTIRHRRTTYSDYWTVERVVEEALKKVTWVYRCVDVISANAARIPMLVRKGDAQDGDLDKSNPLLKILNVKANPYETAWAFRYRLSAQLLTSEKGVFIEVIRDKGERVVSLELLPPQYVTPIPDPKTFVSKFVLDMPIYNEYGQYDTLHREIDPERIIWMKNPHPYDPYLSLTVMPAVGATIETDWYARLYNRNFLLNDGRPGGLVVIKGGIDTSDRDELQARFRGNPLMAGRVSVIASQQGADFIDTAITPRDAQYEVMRRITKEEILLAFGVPESVMSNASNRTFDNAEAERLIFWVEKMTPHLTAITTDLTSLDEQDDRFVVPDFDRVDVLQRNDQKRKEYILKEFDAGVLSVDEYRDATGRKPIPDHGKILFIGNTKVPFATDDGSEIPEMPHLASEVIPGEVVSVGNDQGASPGDTAGSQPNEGRPASQSVTTTPDNEPRQNEGDQRLSPNDSSKKELDDFDANFAQDVDRWVGIAELTVKRQLERQARVVDEKIKGQKMRKLLARRYNLLQDGPKSGINGDKSLSIGEAVDTVFDKETWNKQLIDDMKPVVSGVVKEISEAKALDFDVNNQKFKTLVSLSTQAFTKINDEIEEALEILIAGGASEFKTAEQLSDALPALFESIYDDKCAQVVYDKIKAASVASYKLS